MSHVYIQFPYRNSGSTASETLSGNMIPTDGVVISKFEIQGDENGGDVHIKNILLSVNTGECPSSKCVMFYSKPT